MRALRAALERERPRHQAPDAAGLLRAIDAEIGARVFCCAELLEHAALPSASALRGAIVASIGPAMKPQRLGKFLRRIEGRDLDGLMVCWVGADRDGATWMVRVRE